MTETPVESDAAGESVAKGRLQQVVESLRETVDGYRHRVRRSLLIELLVRLIPAGLWLLLGAVALALALGAWRREVGPALAQLPKGEEPFATEIKGSLQPLLTRVDARLQDIQNREAELDPCERELKQRIEALGEPGKRVAELESQLKQAQGELTAANGRRQTLQEELNKKTQELEKQIQGWATRIDGLAKAPDANQLAGALAASDKVRPYLAFLDTLIKPAGKDARPRDWNKYFELLDRIDVLLKRPQEGKDPPLIEFMSKAAGDAAGSAVENRMSPINNLAAQMGSLEAAFQSLAGELHRQQTTEDVAVVLYHTKSLDAARYVAVVQEWARQHPRDLTPRFRCGYYCASNAEVSGLWPLEEPRYSAEKFLPPSRVAKDAQGNVVKQDSTLEAPKNLNLGEAVFAKAPAANPPPQRRCVLVVSTDCEPLDAVNPHWQNLAAVDVIVIDEVQRPQRDLAAIAERFHRWDEFCRAKNGDAIWLRANAASADQTFDQRTLDALRRHFAQLLIPGRLSREMPQEKKD